MLRKLLRYEIKATGRWFIPLYLALIIFAGINRIFGLIRIEPIQNSMFASITAGISMTVYVTLMIGTLVMTLVVLIQRFYKNLLGDEGYLMFTLPVPSWKHILNKLFSSMVWVIFSGIVALLSIFILILNGDTWRELIRDISMGLKEMETFLGKGIYLIGFEAILLSLLALASGILMIYAAIALGHLFNKHKLLASFGMYIVLGIISESITAFYAVLIDRFDWFSHSATFADIQSILLFIFIPLALSTAGYFILTQYILKNKLNLE